MAGDTRGHHSQGGGDTWHQAVEARCPDVLRWTGRPPQRHSQSRRPWCWAQKPCSGSRGDKGTSQTDQTPPTGAAMAPLPGTPSNLQADFWERMRKPGLGLEAEVPGLCIRGTGEPQCLGREPGTDAKGLLDFGLTAAGVGGWVGDGGSLLSQALLKPPEINSQKQTFVILEGPTFLTSVT